MKIFLDTANYGLIELWAQTGLIDGVTTNPTHLSKESGDPVALIKKLCALLPNGHISVEVTEVAPERVYTQAKTLAALAENVVVKIPCHSDYFPIIKKLVDEEVQLNITLVFSLMQGVCMSKLGVLYISPFVGRLEDLDVDGVSLLGELSDMLDQYDYETELLAASIRHVRHIHAAIEAGVDIITVPPTVLATALNHPLTDRGMELFAADWKKLGIHTFP
ncbi:fructose-6-phosphate aldolase [Candidatus Dependentiae bacterium]|nr:fructose-6-phosphate aldolase [Candidatus Dependentiae bacterium]MCC7414763.1 fructose-6-phosphate aldolase [Campylobacterota bacterium]